MVDILRTLISKSDENISSLAIKTQEKFNKKEVSLIMICTL